MAGKKSMKSLTIVFLGMALLSTIIGRYFDQIFSSASVKIELISYFISLLQSFHDKMMAEKSTINIFVWKNVSIVLLSK